MSEIWRVGDVARIRVRVTDAEKAPADPGGVVLKIKPGDGAAHSDTEVVREGAGSYYADVTLTAPGQWFYEWVLSEPHKGVAEGGFIVKASRF